MSNPFTVYFDASCPLCRREIAFYQRRRGADKIEWVDVSNPETEPEGLSCAIAMRRFHIRRQDGDLVDGGVAFAELWTQLPAFRWLGYVGRVPPLRWLLNMAYALFLPLRPYIQNWLKKRTSP